MATKFWCIRCDKKTRWYSRASILPFCPFGVIWACEVCERENIAPGDEDLLEAKGNKPKRKKAKV